MRLIWMEQECVLEKVIKHIYYQNTKGWVKFDLPFLWEKLHEILS